MIDLPLFEKQIFVMGILWCFSDQYTFKEPELTPIMNPSLDPTAS